jgi:hypothetical protein
MALLRVRKCDAPLTEIKKEMLRCQMHPVHIVDGDMQHQWVRFVYKHQRKVHLVEGVKLIILHRHSDYERTIGHVAAYELVEILNPLALGIDIEEDEIVLADSKRFYHSA